MIVLMSNGNFSLSLRLLEHISFGVSKDERLSFSLTLCFSTQRLYLLCSSEYLGISDIVARFERTGHWFNRMRGLRKGAVNHLLKYSLYLISLDNWLDCLLCFWSML